MVNVLPFPTTVPSNSQRNEGGGIPTAAHLKFTLLPYCAPEECGGTVIVGGTVGENRLIAATRLNAATFFSCPQ